MPDFYIVSSFFNIKSKQARVPTFVWLFRDDATTAIGPGFDEGTNLRLRDFAVVPLMPTRVFESIKLFVRHKAVPQFILIPYVVYINRQKWITPRKLGSRFYV